MDWKLYVENITTKGIGTVICYCTDDEGQPHKNKLNNVLNFPESTVNILSATTLDKSMKDNEETGVPTKRKYYFFTWGFCKYKETISHSQNCLP